MKIALLAALVFASCGGLAAQEALPAGTILPVSLNTSLDTRKVKAGQAIKGTVMQDVPVGGAVAVPANAKVFGSVVESFPAGPHGGAKLVMQFDSLEIGKNRIGLKTNLRAMASMMDVHEAQIPANGPDRGTGENAWTTTQVGGEVVYRGGGPVANALQPVGRPVANGVLVRITARAGSICQGDLSDDDQPQALWVFSSDACGLYGMPEVSLEHAGRSKPVGEIVLTSARKDFKMRSGNGMLLQVISSSPAR